jgi:hypothetical protein
MDTVRLPARPDIGAWWVADTSKSLWSFQTTTAPIRHIGYVCSVFLSAPECGIRTERGIDVNALATEVAAGIASHHNGHG